MSPWHSPLRTTQPAQQQLTPSVLPERGFLKSMRAVVHRMSEVVCGTTCSSLLLAPQEHFQSVQKHLNGDQDEQHTHQPFHGDPGDRESMASSKLSWRVEARGLRRLKVDVCIIQDTRQLRVHVFRRGLQHNL